MDIRRLTYFQCVAETGSLTRAAGTLRVAQPALSRQMRLLEEELGTRLFRRAAHGMELTKQGHQLHDAIAGPIRELQLALQDVRRAGAQRPDQVTIGCPIGLPDQLVRALLDQLTARFPRMLITVVEAATGVLIDWLNRGLVDLALTEEVSRDQRLIEETVGRQALVLVSQKGSLPDGAERLPFARAASLPLIVPSHHLGIRGSINDAASACGITPNIRIQVDSSQLALELVSSGIGHAILPRRYLSQAEDNEAFDVATITDPVMTLEFLAVTRANFSGYPDDFPDLCVHFKGFFRASLAPSPMP